MDTEFDKQWEEKCNSYIKIHDAVVRDNEKLYAENVRLKKAIAAEREACAAKAEQVGQHKNHIGIAAAIRAREQK